MEAMKEQCPSLRGVYERSDAMLAVYPGEGARFAKHIDNTTGTGMIHQHHTSLSLIGATSEAHTQHIEIVYSPSAYRCIVHRR